METNVWILLKENIDKPGEIIGVFWTFEKLNNQIDAIFWRCNEDGWIKEDENTYIFNLGIFTRFKAIRMEIK